METIEVSVATPHLEGLLASPQRALSELIWNALDADANSVAVTFVEQELHGLDVIQVADDGTGMTHAEAVANFSDLGASWKRLADTSKGGRLLHGRHGQGRWLAFGLGNILRWTSTTERLDGERSQIEITGTRAALDRFTITDPEPGETPLGTTVVVTQLAEGADRLRSEAARLHLTAEFALYLSKYPSVSISVDGQPLSTTDVEIKRAELPLVIPAGLGEAALEVVEWNRDLGRRIFLCDEDGFSVGEVPARFHAPGYHFSLYVKWPGFRDRADRLATAELDEDISAVLENARAIAREYFRLKADEDRRSVISRWRAEGVYPYATDAVEPHERTERELFEIVAVTAATAIDAGEARAKKLSLRLIREAIERDPESLYRILGEVVDLSPDRRADLAALLERTTLSQLVSAATQVTDRLDFLRGLETMVFDPEARATVKERSQLHRILAAETWVFGEEYALAVDDESLTTALRRHLGLLGRSDLAEAVDDEVLRLDGSKGILDLMLSRAIERREKRREHLVVELKRPSVRVGWEELRQIKNYAHAVAEDPRFAGTNTHWEFWVVSGEVTKEADRERNVKDKPYGLVHEPDDAPIRVWVKTWAEIIEEAEHRMKFFKDALDVQATSDQGVAYLHRKHQEYVPAGIRSDEAATL